MRYLVHFYSPAIQGWFFVCLHSGCGLRFCWHSDGVVYTRYVQLLWLSVGASTLPY